MEEKKRRRGKIAGERKICLGTKEKNKENFRDDGWIFLKVMGKVDDRGEKNEIDE